MAKADPDCKDCGGGGMVPLGDPADGYLTPCDCTR